MMNKKLKKLHLSIGLCTLMFGCSLTTVRPVQEMSNASSALKSAKDLHADTLVPELYRNASEEYFKAKRDYRLKEFLTAKKHALKSTALSEKAEFQAYLLGGATPEISNKQLPPEGAPTDPEEASKTISRPPADFDPVKLAPEPKIQKPAPEKPEAEQTSTQGTDYNEYLKQQEEQQKKATEKTEKSEPTKPEGQLGPPNTIQSKKDIIKKERELEDYLRYENPSLPQKSSEIPELSNENLPEFHTGEIGQLIDSSATDGPDSLPYFNTTEVEPMFKSENSDVENAFVDSQGDKK